MARTVRQPKVIRLDELEKEEGSYIMIVKGLNYKKGANGRKLTPSERIIGSTIHSFSGRKNGDGTTSKCRRTYKSFHEELGFSFATISHALNGLKTMGYIVQTEGKRSEYDFGRDKVAGKRYYRIELQFLTCAVEVKREGERKLTPAEVLVFAYFYTHIRNDKKDKKSHTASITDIALELGLCEKTVWNAIRTLFRAKIPFRAAEEKGKNRHQKSTYHLNSIFLNRAKKRGKKTDKPSVSTQDKVKEQYKQFDEKADRERFYSIRRNKAESRVDEAERRARSDERYLSIEKDLKQVERETARAEALNLPTLDTLNKQRKLLRMRRAKVLKSLNMTEADFIPQWQCVKCSDTGFLPSGIACDCYQRE